MTKREEKVNDTKLEVEKIFSNKNSTEGLTWYWNMKDRSEYKNVSLHCLTLS